MRRGRGIARSSVVYLYGTMLFVVAAAVFAGVCRRCGEIYHYSVLELRPRHHLGPRRERHLLAEYTHDDDFTSVERNSRLR